MKDRLKDFHEAICSDETMKEEFMKTVESKKADEQISAAVGFAKEKGFDLTEEDFAANGTEVSLDELDSVTGGVSHVKVSSSKLHALLKT